MHLLKALSHPLLMLLLLLAPLAGCKTNDATGRSQLSFLSWEDEVRLGNEAAPEFLEQGGGELPDQQVLNYVRDLGNRLAAESEMPDIAWEFHVLDSQVINAFALPGGKVFMSRGLMEKMTNEAQLAGVIGHEIGHVTARHANDRYAQQIGVTLGVVAVGVAASQSDDDAVKIGAPAAAAAVGTLWTLSYSRGQELESDQLGVRYMTAAGYNPRGQIEVMQILNEASGGRAGAEFLATHPHPETRIARLEQLISTQYALVAQDPRYITNPTGFQRDVLDRLAQLPPAKHSGGQPESAQLQTMVKRAWAAHHAIHGGEIAACCDHAH